MSNVDDDFARDETASVLGEAMAFASNEILILASLEEIFSPKPARLADSEESRKALENRIQRVAQTLGGAPDFIIQLANKPKAKYDTYANAALDEVLTMFNRARVSATRAHMFFMVSRMHQLTPDALKIPQGPELRELLADGVQGAFWEHAETCLIRLASYWDRVGQLLDFAFFGIRQYERDGFPAVMDRIQNNWTAIDSTFREMAAWKALRSYQTSEQTQGLKWLLRRRNLLIHSMSLRPIEPDEEEPLFESAFNHLDSALRKKLAPGSMQEELKGIHEHLAIAAIQLPNVLSVTEHAAKVAFRPYPNGGA
jgi:hypothetical protein